MIIILIAVQYFLLRHFVNQRSLSHRVLNAVLTGLLGGPPDRNPHRRGEGRLFGVEREKVNVERKYNLKHHFETRKCEWRKLSV